MDFGQHVVELPSEHLIFLVCILLFMLKRVLQFGHHAYTLDGTRMLVFVPVVMMRVTKREELYAKAFGSRCFKSCYCGDLLDFVA